MANDVWGGNTMLMVYKKVNFANPVMFSNSELKRWKSKYT